MTAEEALSRTQGLVFGAAASGDRNTTREKQELGNRESEQNEQLDTTSRAC